jgi:hypothetical protein
MLITNQPPFAVGGWENGGLRTAEERAGKGGLLKGRSLWGYKAGVGYGPQPALLVAASGAGATATAPP